MTKTGKRTWSLLLSILLLVTILPQLQLPAAAGGAATEGSCGENLSWALSSSGTLTITGTGSMADYTSASDAPWYNQRAAIKAIRIGDGVTGIGYKAFCQCDNLTSVTIPESVTNIGGYAFYRCSRLIAITIPERVSVIGENAFYDCKGLTSITFHGSAPSFGSKCLTNVAATVGYPCHDLTWTDTVKQQFGLKITWEADHSYVDGVCAVCQSVPIVKILDSGTCGTDLQWQLDELGTLTISGSGPMKNYYKSSNASPWYSNSTSIRSIVIGEGVTHIGDYAFFRCTNLNDITIPANVSGIGTHAFAECSNLTSITFLGAAPSISFWAFDDIVATVYHPCNQPSWTDDTKDVSNREITWIGHVFSDYVIEQDATCTQNAIATGTCLECGATDTVAVPGTATGHSVNPEGLCVNCPGSAADIVIQLSCSSYSYMFDGYAYIDVYADDIFLTRASLELWDISSQTTIPYIPCRTYTFKWDQSQSGGSSLFDISLKGKSLVSGHGNNYSVGDTIYTLESARYHRYQALTTAPTCTQGEITGNTCIYCGMVDVIEAVPATGHSYKESIVPPTCTAAGSVTYTCATCDHSYSIVTPAADHSYLEGVCTICQNTQDAEIVHTGTCGPNLTWKFDNSGTLTISGTGPMGNYSNTSTIWSQYQISQLITNVVIENGVTSIGNAAFRYCDNLASVTIPESVTSIGEYAFYLCDNSLTAIHIPEGVTSIGSRAFQYCTRLTTVTLPETLQTIGSYAFDSCRCLTAVTIPGSVTSIGKNAFHDCNSLETVTISRNVTSIGEDAFYDCNSLHTVTFLGSVPSIPEKCFRNVTAFAYYPCGNETWTEAAKNHYGGNLTWVASHRIGKAGLCTDCGKAPNLIVNVTSSNSNSLKAEAIKIYADGVLLDIATVSFGCSYQTAVPYHHDKTYTFQWLGNSDSQCSFEIIVNGKVLASGDGSNYTDEQIIYTLENTQSHQYETVITPPTCTEEGFTTNTCVYCGFIDVTDPTPATGHSYEGFEIPPTCTDDGFSSGTCTTCGHQSVTELPATGHCYDVNGLCVGCGIRFRLFIYMTDTYGDSWNGAAIEVYTAGTLLTTVSLSQDLLSGNTEVAYVPGATYILKWKSGSSDNECGFKITMNGEMQASGQGSSYSDGQILCKFTVACAHAYQTSETPPTCTQEGFIAGVCTVCGYSDVIETIPATGHSYVDGVCTVCKHEDALASGTCGADLRWRLEKSGTLIITGTGPMDTYSVPEGSDDPNTPWYEHRQLINKVVIENGVTSIGKLAFYNCTSLTDVTIPESVTTIEGAAFRSCSSLTSVTIPEGVTDIGKIVFYDCADLTDITIPGSVTSIGEYAFGKCFNLTTVTFLGAAPSMDPACFVHVTATAYYPCNDETWTDTVKQGYGGMPVWQASHSFGQYIPDRDATCTEDATTTRTCPDCGAVDTKTVPGTATGHTEKTIPGSAATCTEDGLTDGVQCSVCNEVLTTQQTIPAIGHDYRTTQVPSTCTDYGYDLHLCQNCGDSFYNNVTAPTAHHYENGFCTDCGQEESGSISGDATGDGKINMGDVARVFAHVRRTNLLTDANAIACADVTGDGKINMGDVAKIFAHIRGANKLF